MKTCIYLMAWLTCHATVLISQPPSYHLDYLQKHKDLAIREMLRTGIPASIILSQALLESGAGLNDLATKANNHFGIQCGKDWTGSTHTELTYNNDGALEPACFRVYDRAASSYRDYIDQITAPDRISQYRMLFKLETTDYYGWANGLQLTGFSTGGSYAEKLIGIIENYGLHRYDAIFYMQTSLPERYWSPASEGAHLPGSLAANLGHPETSTSSTPIPEIGGSKVHRSEYGYQFLEEYDSQHGKELADQHRKAPSALIQDLNSTRISVYSGSVKTSSAWEMSSHGQVLLRRYDHKPDAGFDHDQFAKTHPYPKVILVHQSSDADSNDQLPLQISLVSKVYHKVDSRESLTGIAHQYQTTVKALIDLNGLKTGELRQGMILQVS